MKINNIEFTVSSEGYAEDNLLLTFPPQEFTHFFSVIQIDKPVTIQDYPEYTIVYQCVIQPEGVFMVQFSKEIDDATALEVITTKAEVTVPEAKDMRADIESMSATLSDSAAINMVWAYPLWIADSHTYVKGDRVQYQDILYKCLANHVSDYHQTPDRNDKWVNISNDTSTPSFIAEDGSSVTAP